MSMYNQYRPAPWVRDNVVGHLSFRALYLNRSPTMKELVYWILDLQEGFASLISVGMEA